MKAGNRTRRFLIFVSLLILPATAGVVPGGQQSLLAMEVEVEEPRILPERSHAWGPDPGGIIFDHPYPPPIIYYYPPPGDPGWPCYHHPGSPPYLHHPPHYGYPPYYEPERPWYEGEPPVPAGRVVLLVDPVQAEAFVNGYPLQRHPDLSYEVGLLQGEHQLMITAEGYAPFQQTVRIRGGERLRLTIRLERNPAR